jgi:hypothetical protein
VGDTDDRGQVEDVCVVLVRVGERIGCTQVALEQPYVLRRLQSDERVVGGAAGEAVDEVDAPARCYEGGGEVIPDEAGAAGDERLLQRVPRPIAATLQPSSRRTAR